MNTEEIKAELICNEIAKKAELKKTINQSCWQYFAGLSKVRIVLTIVVLVGTFPLLYLSRNDQDFSISLILLITIIAGEAFHGIEKEWMNKRFDALVQLLEIEKKEIENQQVENTP